MKADWFFDIHEDTPEQEMTNLLQHSTCTLDISSDEESERKARRDRDEGRDKENVPPVDDVSQTQAQRMADAAPAGPDDMVFEKTRGPLGELNAEDYYPEGCDGSSVVIIAEDDEDSGNAGKDEQQQLSTVASALAPVVVAPEEVPLPFESDEDLTFSPEPKVEVDVSIDVLMGKESDEPASKAAVLQPIEGTGESFELWESGSFRDEAEPIVPGSPRAEQQEPQPEETIAVC